MIEEVKFYVANEDGTYDSICGRIGSVEIGVEEFYVESDTYTPIINGDQEVEMRVRLSKEAILIFYGYYQIIMEWCPNNRVVHLAKHSKKKRIRTKNLNRAIKILEMGKECDDFANFCRKYG